MNNDNVKKIIKKTKFCKKKNAKIKGVQTLHIPLIFKNYTVIYCQTLEEAPRLLRFENH